MATLTETRPSSGGSFPSKKKQSKGQILVDWLTTTDHKKIGYLYLITSCLLYTSPSPRDS